MGVSHPSGGNRPSTLPSRPQGPSVSTRPAERPSLGAISRPSTRPGDIGGSLPGGRPDRPTTLPTRPGDIAGNRPGGRPDRPIIGDGHRPGGKPDRPTTLPTRPGDIGGNRPGGRPDRPIIGDGHRPGGGHRPDWNHPDWGNGHHPGNGNWQNNWHNNWVHNHHNNWYHGCWHGHWGAGWYAPLVWGTTAWGLASLWPTWGYNYGYTYENPYYVAGPTEYDYSQPIVVNNYATADSGGAEALPEAAPPPDPPEVQRSYSLFDQAMEAFKQRAYSDALQTTQRAIRENPRDSLLHEFGALCQFAVGDYAHAAAALNSVLAAAPGMDWTSLIGLYSDADEYTKQLRALEAQCRSNPGDAAAQFVLAYHYLVAGHNDAAASRLKAVVAKQPNDEVAKRLLGALETPEPTPTPDDEPNAATAADSAATEVPAGPTTDLVGNWQAKREGDTFELSVDANGGFAWKAQPNGKKAVQLSGNYVVTGDTLVLDGGKQQGVMVARVASGGPGAFQFVTVNAPPGDKGLEFQRIAAGKE